jgi:hypothetical protein
MKRHPLRRRTAALAVVLAASAAGALTGTVPATAATTTPVITLQAPLPAAVPAGVTKGIATTVQPSFDFRTTASSVDTDATLTIDARKLAKVAHVTFSQNCTVKASVATCSEFFSGQNLAPNFGLGTITHMDISTLKGVPTGTTGTYTVTGTAAHAKIVGASGSVVIGGPAFSQTLPKNYTNLTVGSTVSEAVRFSNIGTRPAAAATIILMTSPGLDFATHYANCKYSAATNTVTSGVALCTIPGSVRVGETAELSTPVQLRVNSTAYYTYLDTITAPAFDPAEGWVVKGRTWKQGTGATLGLHVITAGRITTATAGTVSLQQAGANTKYQIASLQAHNTANFGVSGATVTAAQGQTAKLTFRMANHGPATIYYRSGNTLGVLVTLPPGTTAVGSSANCFPSTANDPAVQAHGPYSCSGSYLVPNSQEYTFTITLRVDTVIPHAKGKVAMDWSPNPTWRPAFDTVASDDSRDLTVN